MKEESRNTPPPKKKNLLNIWNYVGIKYNKISRKLEKESNKKIMKGKLLEIEINENYRGCENVAKRTKLQILKSLRTKMQN